MGTPVVGPLEEPTVDEDAELAIQVYNQLPKYTQGRRVLIAPHSRGSLVGAALAHLLIDQGVDVAGMIAFQPYIYWQLEHMFNELRDQIANNISSYLQSFVPLLARLLTPLYARSYDSMAEYTAEQLANGVRNLVFNTLVTAQANASDVSENFNFPTVLSLALQQVLPNASSDEISNIVEKLKGMQPTATKDAEFLGARLADLDIPMVIVSSEIDDLSTPSMATSLGEFTRENEINDIGFILLSGEGHYFVYEKPSGMANMIRVFWAQVQ